MSTDGENSSQIDAFSSSFEPERYTDTYRDALCELIKAKRKGETIERAEVDEDREDATDIGRCGQHDDADLEEVRDEERRHRGEQTRDRNDGAAREFPAAEHRGSNAEQRAEREREDRGAGQQRETAQHSVEHEIDEWLAVEVRQREAR